MWRLHYFCIKFKTDILGRLKNIKNKKIDSSKPEQEKSIVNKAINMPLNITFHILITCFFTNKAPIFSTSLSNITYNFKF